MGVGRIRHLLVILLSGALLAFAAAPAAQARVKVVYAGPVTHGPAHGDFNAFFRRQVTINAGDSVRWVEHGFHTVTFAPGRSPALVVPDPSRPIAGVLDPAGAAFWFNGQPSLRVPPAVASRSGAAVVSSRAYHNSGLPVTPRPAFPYTLRFTRVGTYHYVCVVHPGMAGSVRVLPRGFAVPSAFADRRAAAAEQAADARVAAIRSRYTPPAGVVTAGHDLGSVALFRFFPSVTTIRAGQSLRFVMASRTEVHTVTFGPAPYRKALEAGLVAVGKPSAPRQPPPVSLSPRVFLPSDPLPALPPYTGANHGNGFLNSGLLDTIAASPYPASATIAFPTRGSFAFECLIHPGMLGQVNVT